MQIRRSGLWSLTWLVASAVVWSACGGSTLGIDSVESSGGEKTTEAPATNPTGPTVVVDVQDMSAVSQNLSKVFNKASHDAVLHIVVNAYNVDNGELLNTTPGVRDPVSGKAKIILDQYNILTVAGIIRFEAVLPSGAIFISLDAISASRIGGGDQTVEIDSPNSINATSTLAFGQMLEAGGKNCTDSVELRTLPPECRNFEETLAIVQDRLNNKCSTTGAALKKMRTLMLGCALVGTASGCENPAAFVHEVIAGADGSLKGKAEQFSALAGEKISRDDLASFTSLSRSASKADSELCPSGDNGDDETETDIAVDLENSIPGADAVDVAVNSPVVVAFTEAVDPLTLDGIQLLLEGNKILAVRSLKNEKTIQLTPIEPLQVEKTYTVSVSSDLQSASGEAVKAIFWHFKTVLNPFELTSLSPSCDSSNNPTNSQIVVSFSHPLAVSSFTSANFSVVGCDASGHLGPAILSEDGKSVTRTPASPYLDPLTTCHLTLSRNIQDVNGRLLGNNASCAIGLGRGVDVTNPVFGGITGAVANDHNSVTLSWELATDDLTAQTDIVYDAYYLTNLYYENFFENNNNSIIATTSAPGANSIVVNNLVPGTRYYFAVRARDQTGNHDNNIIKLSATTDPLAGPPTHFSATVGENNQINLSWDPVDGANYYKIYYGGNAPLWPLDVWNAMSVDAGDATSTSFARNSDLSYSFQIVAGYNGVELTVRSPVLPSPDPSGILDSKFGSGGYYKIYQAWADGEFRGFTGLSGAIDGSGRIIVGGSIKDPNADWYDDRDTLVTRIRSTGVWDGVNGAGHIDTDFNGMMFNLGIPGMSQVEDDAVNGVAIDASGKIWSAGTYWKGDALPVWGSRAFLCKINSDGSPDGSLGGDRRIWRDGGWQNFCKTLDFPATDSEGYAITQTYANAIQIHPASGKIYVAGAIWNQYTTQEFLTIWRFNADGSNDASFGNSGLVSWTPGGAASLRGGVANAMAIDSSGRLVITGNIFDNSTAHNIGGLNVAGLWRFSADGVLDNSFGSGGVVSRAEGADHFVYGRGVAVDGNGKIVVVGSAMDDSWNYDAFIWRFNADGSIDNSFSDDGVVTYGSGGLDEATSVVLGPTGKIYVTGTVRRTGEHAANGDDMFLMKFKNDGSAERTFGTNGIILFDCDPSFSQGVHGVSDKGNALLYDYNTNKIVVIGQSDQSYQSLALWRYWP